MIKNIYYSKASESNSSPVALKFNCQFTMSRCKFINARARLYGEGNVVLIKFKVDLTIQTCEFINCGNGLDQCIINHTESSINIQNSIFKFDNIDKSCRVLDMNMSDVTIESCTFTNFIPNIINIKSKSDTGPFIFHSNTIENIR